MEEKIERQIELHESKVTYKNHTLWLRSYELKAGGWSPKAVVVLPEAEGNGERELEGESTFALLEEADTEAFHMAQQWIDQKSKGGTSDQEVILP